jgi:hypothetical protein
MTGNANYKNVVTSSSMGGQGSSRTVAQYGTGTSSIIFVTCL